MEAVTTLLEPRPLPNFVQTPYIRGIVDRALTYIAAGFPIHFRGSWGTGKTTLAMHVAGLLERPVVMLHGDEEFSTSDLVGAEGGYHMRKVIDNFIHSVLKTEEDMSRQWVDNRLTIACQHGFTLIYDEFTRSRPEANNVLLSVLQERLLDLPPARDGQSYLRVHPQFTAIFTSNPEEYAGIYRTQDALRDRMITIDLDHFDEETEMGIVQAKSGLPRDDVERIVGTARAMREEGLADFAPTVRGCIMVARAAKVKGCAISASDRDFRQICQDILGSESFRIADRDQTKRLKEVLNSLIDLHC